MRSGVQNGRFGLALAGIPAVALVGFVVVLPLLLLIRMSFDLKGDSSFTTGTWTLDNFGQFFTTPFYQKVLLNTILMAGTTTAACLVLGLPLAYFIARSKSRRLKGIMIILLVLPILVGNAARVVGWAAILADRGVFNSLISALGYDGSPIRILYTGTAVFISLVSVLLPFMVITLQGTVEAIPESLEEAAAGLGGNAIAIARRVIIPLAMPGLFAGGSLCFILAMSAYAAPVLLGGSTYQMMAPLIYEQITTVSNWPFAASIAMVLVATTVLVTLAFSLILERRYGRV